MVSAGCADMDHRQGARTHLYVTDTRQSLPLSPLEGKELRAVMLQHLETIQVIVDALAEQDYDLAKKLTEAHLAFFMRRHPLSPTQAQVRQDAPFPLARQEPEHFPPTYHDLARIHHDAAEGLAHVIPTKDLKQILPELNNVLKACVACHLEFKVLDAS